MRRMMVQITMELPPAFEVFDAWVDLMELPSTVNDIGGWADAFAKDQDGRKVRIVEVMEERS